MLLCQLNAHQTQSDAPSATRSVSAEYCAASNFWQTFEAPVGDSWVDYKDKGIPKHSQKYCRPSVHPLFHQTELIGWQALAHTSANSDQSLCN